MSCDADDLLLDALRLQQSCLGCSNQPHSQFAHHRYLCRVTLPLPDARLHQVTHHTINVAIHESSVCIHRCIECDQLHRDTHRIKKSDGIGIIERQALHRWQYTQFESSGIVLNFHLLILSARTEQNDCPENG